MDVGTADTRITGVVLPADATAPGRARWYAARVLAAMTASEDAVDAALLVTSELVTNAVKYGRADRVHFTIAPCGGSWAAVRLTVADRTPYAPLPPVVMADELAECGRGLALVELLAKRWGHRRAPGGGTAVWAEVPL